MSNKGDLYQPLLKRLGEFFRAQQPDARRIFHGRGRCYPGLEHVVADWFAPVVLITVFDKLAACVLLLEATRESDALGQIEGIVLQRRAELGAPSQLLWGKSAESFSVSEGELLFEVHPGVRQNVGLFLNMRLARDWLRANSSGRNVLNLFAVSSCAGGRGEVRDKCRHQQDQYRLGSPQPRVEFPAADSG